MNIAPNIRFIDMPENLRSKYQYFTEAKVNKLEKNGFLTACFSMEDAVNDYIVQYLIPNRRLGQFAA